MKHLFCVVTRFPPAATGFSRALDCGARRGSAGTLRCGRRPGSVARALGVQSSARWLFFKGLRSAPPSQAGSWEPQIGCVHVCTPEIEILK